MSFIPDKIIRGLRNLVNYFQGVRSDHKDAMRPIPEAIIEKYHRAIWAIDTLGPVAKDDRWKLRETWRLATHVAANASGPEGGAIAEDLIQMLNAHCEKIIRECEKDGNRAIWEKQRDFLCGSLRRVRRAMQLNDIEHLHFYEKAAEIFNVETNHPTFQIGYHLWQGVREELKAAVTYTLYDNKPLHPKVEYLIAQTRAIIKALDTSDVTPLGTYDPTKSPLHLSPEQEGRILWDGVREHSSKVIAMGEA